MKKSRNPNVSDFLNILISNSKHLDILNFLIFVNLCTKIHIISITTFAVNRVVLETEDFILLLLSKIPNPFLFLIAALWQLFHKKPINI